MLLNMEIMCPRCLAGIMGFLELWEARARESPEKYERGAINTLMIRSA